LGKTVRVERGRKRVEFTGFERHGLYGVEDFFLRDSAERCERSASEGRLGRGRLRRQSVKGVTQGLNFGTEVGGEDGW
jgi:hypothetical protein